MRRRFGAWARPELPSVQILVVVANIQVRTLKTEVEKGSLSTTMAQGSVDPKAPANAVSHCGGALRCNPVCRKGSRSIFLHQDKETFLLLGGMKRGNANELADAERSPG